MRQRLNEHRLSTPAPHGECSQCGYVGPAEVGKSGCPKCGAPWKSIHVYGTAHVSGKGSISFQTRDLADKEFENILRTELKRYLQDKLGPFKVTTVDSEKSLAEIRHRVSQQITSPDFASVVMSYISLRSQEQQASTNNKLQCLFAILALGTLLTGAVSVWLAFLTYLRPP